MIMPKFKETLNEHIMSEAAAASDDKGVGRKFDSNKLEYGLIPPHALREMVRVLTFGAQKYERNNWKYVSESKRRYFDALQRHVWAWKTGEHLDPESGIHHLAHAACCLFFLLEREILTDEEWEKHNEK